MIIKISFYSKLRAALLMQEVPIFGIFFKYSWNEYGWAWPLK